VAIVARDYDPQPQ